MQINKSDSDRVLIKTPELDLNVVAWLFAAFRCNHLQIKSRLQYILWPPDVKSRLTGKDPDVGKD